MKYIKQQKKTIRKKRMVLENNIVENYFTLKAFFPGK